MRVAGVGALRGALLAAARRALSLPNPNAGAHTSYSILMLDFGAAHLAKKPLEALGPRHGPAAVRVQQPSHSSTLCRGRG